MITIDVMNIKNNEDLKKIVLIDLPACNYQTYPYKIYYSSNYHS